MARTDRGDAVTLSDVTLHYRLNARTHIGEEPEMASPCVTRHLLKAVTLSDANLGSLKSGLMLLPHGFSPHYAGARDPFHMKQED